MLASGSNDGYVRIWDWEAGSLVREHSAHPKGVNQVMFQPGGSLLVSAGNDALVQLWDTASGENRGYLIGGAFAVPDLAFLPGGSQLLTVDGGVIRVREVDGGRLVTSLRVGDSVPVIVPDPTGTWVAASIKPAVLQIWGLAESELRSEVQLVDLRDVWAMALNPAGDLLAVGGRDGSICLVPTDSLAEYTCQQVSERPISALAFLPDGRGLVSGGYDGMLNLWQVLQ
jgi:WD40 repeat protein